jgi:hypothetical protein
LVAVLSTACVGAGDVTVVNMEQELRTSEIREVFALLSEAFTATEFDASPQSPAAVAGLQMAPVPINSSFGVSVPCEAGSVSVAGTANGTLDDQTLEGSLSLQLTWDFDGCAITGSYGTLTVNGKPDISFIANYVIASELMTVAATQNGGFSYSVTDGRSGDCAISLSYDASYNTTTNEETGTVNGAVCGKPAEEFEDFLI